MTTLSENFFNRVPAATGRWLGTLLLTLWLGAPWAHALKPQDKFTLADLEAEPTMTPGEFASLFAFFTFEYRPFLQGPEVFLRNRSGDCDDYAVLADHLLRRHNYKTRLIRVELVGTNVRHVVCYVTEKKAYLDYNNRRYFLTLERSSPSLRSIANKVADSFEKNWTSVSEFKYNYGDTRQQLVWTVLKTDPPSRDPDRLAANAN